MGKLGFDLRPLQAGYKAHKERGIGVYTRSLINRRHLAPKGLELATFYDSLYEAEEPAAHDATPYITRGLYSMVRPYLKEYVNQHIIFRMVAEETLEQADADRMFFPSHLDAPSGLIVPYVVTAHDMIQAALKERYYKSIKNRMYIEKQIEVLRDAQVVIAVSQNTKRDVVRYASVEAKKIVVIYNGVDPEFRPGVTKGAERFNLPEKFILNVGGIDWRKNTELLFDAFAALVSEKPEYHLVMTGAIDTDPLYRRFIESMTERGLESKVKALGYVSKDELVALYNRAEVFFYPSIYEGFGLPVLEAMACGAPVISTNRSSIPEVADDAAVLLDPDKPEDFVEALSRLTGDEDKRRRLSEAGIKRAAMFTWDRCAEETYKTLAAF